jgi:hypothetical protein
MQKQDQSVTTVNGFTFVDLRYHYDERILKKFYNDFLMPNFGIIPDELDPIDVWVDALQEENPSNIVAHLVVVFENLPQRSGSHKGTNNSTQHWSGFDPLGLMVGGCCFEYMIASNSVLLSYFCLNERTRGKGVSKLLANQAEFMADQDAVRLRNKNKVDGFYLETNKASISHDQDVMDPRDRHRILFNLGFRAINMRYVQPPLSPESRSTDCLWLAIRLSSPHMINYQQFKQLSLRNPSLQEFKHAQLPVRQANGKVDKYYVPSVVVKSFITDFWLSCVKYWKPEAALSTEVDLQHMIAEVDKQPILELLELPWELFDDQTNVVEQLQSKL